MLYLASQSPQRARLLERAGVLFQVVASVGDEESMSFPSPQVTALERARVKARGAQVPVVSGAIALGADTVVSLGMEIFGKPRDRADAERILARLQGTTHSVYTGHCCVRFAPDGTVAAEALGVSSARVTMRPMSAEDIRTYVASGESDGRAGAYAIQETGDRFVVDVQGSWSAVVGLNLPTADRLHREVCDSPLPGYRPDANPSALFKALGGPR